MAASGAIGVICTAQGLAPAAPAFNIHLAHGFNTALKELWRKMWILYTDDLLLMGESEEEFRKFGYPALPYTKIRIL